MLYCIPDTSTKEAEMFCKTTVVLSMFTAVAMCGSVHAQNSTNDEMNYTGDRLSFPVNVNASYKGSDNVVHPLCIPAETTLRGLGPMEKDTLHVRLATFSDDVPDCSGSVPPVNIPKNVAISVHQDNLNFYKPNRYGLTYGALVVPYKYHFSGSKNFEGNSTVGPFLGYRFDKNTLGVGIKIVGFLGGAVIKVTETVDNTQKDKTLAGFSYGIGILGEIKSDFQLGLVFGADRVSNDSGYEDNGKLWGALALGFSFVTK
jgi:hypothetical protein